MATIPIDLKEGKLAGGEIIVGIDLGTTNSLVAIVENGQPRSVKNSRGDSGLVPSIIYFGEDGNPIVGDKAKDQLVAHPERTIYSVKRLMGKSYGDLDSMADFFSYKIIESDEESLVKIRIDDQFHNPVSLSAVILAELKERVEKALGRNVRKAVITVPAYFNDVQRQATRDAGKLAGLDVLRIINEPTAASLAYGLDAGEEAKTIVVYDLGGGTFDVSILQMEGGVFEVLSTHGDTFLGGDDFDQAIVQYWIDTDQLGGLDMTDPTVRQQLRLLAEKAKITLSKTDQFTETLHDHTLSLSRSQFTLLATPLVDRTLRACQHALQDAKLSPKDIDHVVLVGGSTRMPVIKEQVSTFFGQEVYDDLNPDEVVALGAAIQADILAGNQKGFLLLDVTPLSLGIETVGGLMDVIIPRNSKVPTQVGRNYTTSVDGQKNLKIAVYQGERDLVEDNRKLGEFILREIPPMPMGIPKIEVQFLIDADGILKVRAAELRSNTEQSLEIHSAYSLSEEEMSLMLIDSLQNAQRDIAEKAVREAINEGQHLIKSTEKFIVQNERIFDRAFLENLNDLNKAVQIAIDERDKNKIERAMESLNEYATPLAHTAMDKSILDAIKDQKV
ncbi:MAG: molecular chaperone DnaK [Saprospiraceae bacterium]|nr:molecular chaperone DnaK [Saprospiraceae bacterium]